MKGSHEEIRQSLATITLALKPFVERELERVYGESWPEQALQALDRGRSTGNASEHPRWDVHSLMTVIWERWHEVFKDRFGPAERSVIGELRHARNRWAHQDEFDFDDTYRVLDNTRRLLLAAHSEHAKEAAERQRAWLRGSLTEEPPAAVPVEENSRLNGRTWDLWVFVICGTALGLQVVLSFGSWAWPAALLAGVSFTYILYRRLTQVHVQGALRCSGCLRTIYTEDCPYCENGVEPVGRDSKRQESAA